MDKWEAEWADRGTVDRPATLEVTPWINYRRWHFLHLRNTDIMANIIRWLLDFIKRRHCRPFLTELPADTSRTTDFIRPANRWIHRQVTTTPSAVVVVVVATDVWVRPSTVQVVH